ncbi:type IV pilin protein [Herminiimonas glaciei]|uniref:Type IV pilin protein n=1 Tax=Herminiimonas glaciei TaxID=523788 RepID=A0ABW2IDI4_9BURK
MKHIYLPNMRASRGFTLMELMITMVIIGILAAIAVPMYSAYVTRSKIPEATSALAGMRIRLEQYYQDNRNYGSTAAACGLAVPSGSNFTYTCVWRGTDQTYLITANGVGSMNGFTYTIDEGGNRATSAVPAGWGTAPISCWVSKKGGEC